MYRHSADDIKESNKRKFCTPEQIEEWDNKSDSDHTHDGLGVITPEEIENIKTKLEGIEENANKYVHPNDTTTRHVTDEQISKWDSKSDGDHTHEGLGNVTGEELDNMKDKLDGIEPEANKYVHPNDANTRHVTDVQISKWDTASDKVIGGEIGGGSNIGTGTITPPSDLTLVVDPLADSVQGIVIEGTPAQTGIFKITDLRLGKYVITIRAKTCHSNNSDSTILVAKIRKKGEERFIAEANYSESKLTNTDYSYLYLVFDYKGPKSENNELELLLEAADVNHSITVDYVVVSPIIPSVYY